MIKTPLLHHCSASASGNSSGELLMSASGADSLAVDSPVEFGGPGDHWSPETLLVGAVADCFVLTFRGIARASKVDWLSIECDVTGTLDRVDLVTQFTDVNLQVRVTIPEDCDQARTRQALDKAERFCLISNSLKAAIHLDASVETRPAGIHARCA